MSYLYAALYLALFVGTGVLLAGLGLPREPLAARVAVGLSLSVVLQAWLPALPALFLGFRLPSVLVGAALCAALFLVGLRLRPREAARGRFGPAFWACVLPMLALGCALLFTHTLSPRADGSLWAGQSTYGDLPMHLAFIKSLAENGVFPPVYTLVAGDLPMSYPFLCETVSSALLLLGLPLRAACLAPQFIALAAVFCGAYELLRQVFDHAGKAALAFYLFFMGSGFGFFYFLGGRGNFSRIFTAFYETPTNYVAENIVWVNPIVDLLVPQRATLFGWAILFSCLYLLCRLAFARDRRVAPLLGLMAGALPLLHTHSFLALAVVSAVLLIYALLDRERPPRQLAAWLLYAGLAAAAALPQVLCFTLGASGAQHFVRFSFNWVNAGRDNYFWFYIKNIGLVYLLAPLAFFRAPRPQRWLYGGGLALLALCEFIVFQPNAYDNNKLLYIWHFMGCMLAAELLWQFAAGLRRRRWRRAAAGLAVFCATFGSLLTVGRELVSGYQQFGVAEVRAAAWAESATSPAALFLTADNHNNALASLAGRRILCGSGSYLYYHGLDYGDQYGAMQRLLTDPDEALLAQWGIDYAWFSSYERAADGAEAWYAERYPAVYSADGVTVYRIR